MVENIKLFLTPHTKEEWEAFPPEKQYQIFKTGLCLLLANFVLCGAVVTIMKLAQ